jgi:cytochrome c biogenesis protein CcdA
VIEHLIGRLSDVSLAGPVLGFVVGALLGLSPVALPTVPAVMGLVSPGWLDDEGKTRSRQLARASTSIFSFTLGMNGVLGLAGYLFVTVSVVLARAAVALSVTAAVLMAIVGLRLILRRSSLCTRAASIPPKPSAAFWYGVGFSIGGCPGCGPISLGVGAAAAAVAGPLYGVTIVTTFVLGHAAVLLAAAVLGARLVPTGSASWHRMDRLVGGLFVLAGVYYSYRVLSGEVTTLLPGEEGSNVLP